MFTEQGIPAVCKGSAPRVPASVAQVHHGQAKTPMVTPPYTFISSDEMFPAFLVSAISEFGYYAGGARLEYGEQQGQET